MLFPFSLIYWVIIRLRNKLFDWNILKSSAFNFPLICVGNLAVGGTGKTPMTELIAGMLKNDYRLAILSRGYKRKTRGFAIANASTTAIEIGDEPMQFHLKFPDITVAVGEERLVAIPQILFQHPDTQAIILDDAFQHRSVRAGLNIILTEYNNLFTRDLMLPTGDLRDTHVEKKRAQIIVVTKCPADISNNEKQKIIAEINPAPHQTVYFTTIQYGHPYQLFDHQTTVLNANTDVLLVCAIANPKPLKEKLNQTVHYYEMMSYPDHHIFSFGDLKEIKKHFEAIVSNNKIILTTEKDAVRLLKFGDELNNFPIYAIPVTHEFLFEEKGQFQLQLTDFISSYKANDPMSTIITPEN